MDGGEGGMEANQTEGKWEMRFKTTSSIIVGNGCSSVASNNNTNPVELNAHVKTYLFLYSVSSAAIDEGTPMLTFMDSSLVL